MTTGYILIAAVLILGGVIATVGDRLGTRVGKARLSLFNLRPRKTAVLVTILTGSIISASTLATLFAVDERLRTGVFRLEKIQADLRHQRQQLEATTIQKDRVEQELAQAKAEQKAEQIQAQKREIAAQKRLQEINMSLQVARAEQAQTQAELNRTQAQQAQTQIELNRTTNQKAQTQAELNRTQTQVAQVTSQFQEAQNRLKSVSERAKALRLDIQTLQTELQQLSKQRDQLKAQIAQRDAEIAKLDQNIAQRDRTIIERGKVIAQRENRLTELETQQNYLEQEARSLQKNLQVLRQGQLALVRGQILAGGVLRIVQPTAARQAVDQLLREANRVAIEKTQPGINATNKRVVEISQAQVDQLINQIDDGRDYVVRIISGGNYVVGDQQSIRVFTDATPNQVVFRAGDVLAAVPANPATMSETELRQRVDLLVGASNFRAQRAGLLTNSVQVADNRIETLIRFVKQLKQYNQPVEMKAVAAELTYTTGPLKVQLVAIQNGQVVFRT